MPIIQDSDSLRQETQEFETRQGYIVKKPNQTKVGADKCLNGYKCLPPSSMTRVQSSELWWEELQQLVTYIRDQERRRSASLAVQGFLSRDGYPQCVRAFYVNE